MRNFFLCLPLLYSYTVMAQDYQLVYRELSQLQKTVVSSHGTQIQYFSPALNELNFSYMANIGAIYTINYVQPLAYWLKQQRSNNVSLRGDNYVAEISPEQAKQDFDKIRTQAKELSHQIYSLERKIKSMQKSIQALEVDEQVAMKNQIKQAQQQLLSLTSQKSALKAPYEQSKQRLSYIPAISSNPEQYLRFFEQEISKQLCHLSDLVYLLPAKERLTFILKQTGPLKDDRYQDTNYNFKMENLRACNEQKISQQALIQGATKHYF